MMMTVQKILIITQRFYPMPGGMAESATRIVRGLKRRDIETDVLVFDVGDKGVTLNAKVKDRGLEIWVSHHNQQGNAAQRSWRKIYECHCQKPYDVIIGFGIGASGLFAVTAAKWLGITSLVSVRGNDFDRDWFEPKLHATVSETLNLADGIIAVTKEKVAKIKALFPDKPVYYVPNGIDFTENVLLGKEHDESELLRSTLSKNDRRIIGFFGELKYKKRIPFFLSVIREAGLIDRLTLLVVGKTDVETQAILDDSVLTPHVHQKRYIPKEKLLPYYAACDFIAIPSLFEGFPNVLLEAMVQGAIPIVSDAGALGDVVKHGKNGFIFPAENRNAVLDVLTSVLLLSDDQMKQMKTAISRQVKELFSCDKELDHLLEVIQVEVTPATSSRNALKN